MNSGPRLLQGQIRRLASRDGIDPVDAAPLPVFRRPELHRALGIAIPDREHVLDVADAAAMSGLAGTVHCRHYRLR